MWYVYVLRDAKKNYVGVTHDLKRRFREYSSGQTYSTKRMGHLLLIFYEAFLSKSDAYRQEQFYKSGYGREVLRQKLTDTLSDYSGVV